MLTRTDAKVAFEGIKVRPLLTDVAEDSLTSLKAGETYTVKVDVASVNDLTSGGVFSLLSQGSIPYAEAGSTELTDSILFKSNSIDLDVDAKEAKSVAKVFKDIRKRTVVQSDCTGSKLTNLRSALSDCASLASAAATAATSGSSTKCVHPRVQLHTVLPG
jgi:deuterolysin